MEDKGKVTDAHIASLAAVIATKHMESIAEKYLGIDWEAIENLKAEHRGDTEAINRSIIRKWAFKNPGQEQVKVSVNLRYY